MTVSMYTASVPVFINMLTNLRAIVDYAEQEFSSRKVDPQAILTARLFPDMYPFAQQINRAVFHATAFPASLAGEDAPAPAGDADSYAGLKTRISGAIGYLEKIGAAGIDGKEEADVSYIVANQPRAFQAQTLLLNHCMPNFMFHIATAYDLLRHNGLEIGKRHLLGYAAPGS